MRLVVTSLQKQNYLFVCLFVFVFVCLFVFVVVCLLVCLFICLFNCVCVFVVLVGCGGEGKVIEKMLT